MSTNNENPAVIAPAASPNPTRPAAPSPLRKRLLMGGAALVAVILILVYGVPWVYAAFTEESTDDAYVNGYPTFVAPRVSGQVKWVGVKDNNRVKKGDPIVKLDPEPYQDQVNQKAAELENAKRDLEAAQAGVRAQIGLARSNRYKLQNTIEGVNRQIEQLRGNVEDLNAAKARRARALSDFIRVKDLKNTPGATSAQEYDLRYQDLRVANAQVKQVREQAYQTRAALGLPAQPEIPKSEKNKPAEPDPAKDPPKEQKDQAKADKDKDKDPAEDSVDLATDKYLTVVPPGLDQSFSAVRQAQFELVQSGAPLNIVPKSYNLSPQQMLDEVYARDPKGDIDGIVDQIMKQAPAIKQAEAKVQIAEADLKIAELNLSYCTVKAEVDGLITRRNVNEGNNLQAGQQIMAIRPIREIWIDANFKETQLRNLRIGQYVRLEVDTYGSHHTFHGHITGFAMGTGSTLALLPPENATGNFVKVVQRLPVRIELDDYDPDRGDPVLFLGLSVEPHVYLNRPATGPDAGKVLQPPLTPTDPPKQAPPVNPPADKPKGGKP